MGGLGERPSRACHQWRARLRGIPLRTRRMGRQSPGRRMEKRGNRHQRARTLRRFVASAGRSIYQSFRISKGGAAAKASCHPCRMPWFLAKCRRSIAWRRTMRRRCLPEQRGWGTPCRRRWNECFGRVLPDRHDEHRGAHQVPQDEVLRRGGHGDVHIALQPRERSLHTSSAPAAAAGRIREAHGLPGRLDRHSVERQGARTRRIPTQGVRELDVRQRHALGRREDIRRRSGKGV